MIQQDNISLLENNKINESNNSLTLNKMRSKFKHNSLFRLVLLLLLGTVLTASCKKEDPVIEEPTTTEIFSPIPSTTVAPTADITVTTESKVRYHLLNFHSDYPIVMVETETGVVLVDAGSLEFAGVDDLEIKAYADAIGKPVDILITHDHFDHWGAIAQFTNSNIYTVSEVATVLNANEGFIAEYPNGIIGVPHGTTLELAGVDFNFYSISATETSENAYFTIPSLKALFVGDLATGGHEYIREYTPLDETDELDIWIGVLNLMKINFGDYNHIFFGHYVSSTSVSSELDRVIDYITVGQALIKGTQTLTAGGIATSVEEVVTELELLFPTLPSGGLYFALPNGFFPGDPGAIWF